MVMALFLTITPVHNLMGKASHCGVSTQCLVSIFSIRHEKLSRETALSQWDTLIWALVFLMPLCGNESMDNCVPMCRVLLLVSPAFLLCDVGHTAAFYSARGFSDLCLSLASSLSTAPPLMQIKRRRQTLLRGHNVVDHNCCKMFSCYQATLTYPYSSTVLFDFAFDATLLVCCALAQFFLTISARISSNRDTSSNPLCQWCNCLNFAFRSIGNWNTCQIVTKLG